MRRGKITRRGEDVSRERMDEMQGRRTKEPSKSKKIVVDQGVRPLIAT